MQAMLEGNLTCTQLVSAYVQVGSPGLSFEIHRAYSRRAFLREPKSVVLVLQRINQFDAPGPNAYRVLSPSLVADAATKDAQLLAVGCCLLACLC